MQNIAQLRMEAVMQLLRTGIFEYDKRAPVATKPCADCGATIERRGGKQVCAPCYDKRLAARKAVNHRRAYLAKKVKSTLRRMLLVQGVSGRAIILDPGQVRDVRAVDGVTHIYGDGDKCARVLQTVDEVRAKMRECAQWP